MLRMSSLKELDVEIYVQVVEGVREEELGHR